MSNIHETLSKEYGDSYIILSEPDKFGEIFYYGKKVESLVSLSSELLSCKYLVAHSDIKPRYIRMFAHKGNFIVSSANQVFAHTKYKEIAYKYALSDISISQKLTDGIVYHLLVFDGRIDNADFYINDFMPKSKQNSVILLYENDSLVFNRFLECSEPLSNGIYSDGKNFKYIHNDNVKKYSNNNNKMLFSGLKEREENGNEWEW